MSALPGNELSLHVARDVVTTVDTLGQTTRTPSWITLSTQKAAVVVVAVGESESQLRANCDELLLDGKSERAPAFIRPGENAWWDAQWQWPRGGLAHPGAPRRDESELLTLCPFERVTWSPQLADRVFLYVLTRTLPRPTTWQRLLRPFRFNPAVTVSLSRDFDEIERGELVDALRLAWGRHRVRCGENAQVGPTPITTLDRRHRLLVATTLLLSVATLVALAQPYGGAGRYAPAVALFVLMWIQNKVADARGRQAPRRSI